MRSMQGCKTCFALSSLKVYAISNLWWFYFGPVFLQIFLFFFFPFLQHRLVPCFNLYFGFVLRDGVSESQFNQVLNIELEQMIKVLIHL